MPVIGQYHLSNNLSKTANKRFKRNGSGVELRVQILCPAIFFTLLCSSSLSSVSCINEYMAIVVGMCTSSLRTLIVANGWMLPREAEMVSE